MALSVDTVATNKASLDKMYLYNIGNFIMGTPDKTNAFKCDR